MIGALAAWSAAAAAQTADPQLLVLSCAGCHGPDGRSPSSIPPLHGQDASTISGRMRAFREERTPSTVMGRIAKGYSDTEIDALAKTMAASWK